MPVNNPLQSKIASYSCYYLCLPKTMEENVCKEQFITIKIFFFLEINDMLVPKVDKVAQILEKTISHKSKN